MLKSGLLNSGLLNRGLATALAAGSMLLLAQDKLGQNKPAQADAATAAAHMIVTVEARKGKEVPSINREDVMIYEAKQRLAIADFTPGSDIGLELFLVIDDASGDSLGSQLDSLASFVEGQPASTAVGLAYMRNGSAYVAQNPTKDHALAAKALRLPLASPAISPSPFESVSDLMKRWPASSARHEMILVSSGVSAIGGDTDNPYLKAAIELAQKTGVVVYAIYNPAAGHLGHSAWRLNWGQSHLAELADKTGGESYMLGFGPLVSFAPYLDEIAVHLAHQYRVGFLAKAGNKAGLQPVKVSTEVPNAELVAPGKVWAAPGL